MSRIRDGFAAAEGLVSGRVHLFEWGVPEVPHRTVSGAEVEEEVARFEEARDEARERLEGLKALAEERLGGVEARIFDPQIMMVDDPDLVGGTLRYIRELHLSAPRAFEWRILELKDRWARTGNPLVLDRLNDLEDLEVRILHSLLGLPAPDDLGTTNGGEGGVVVVARNLTPSLTVQLDPERVAGIVTDEGTRTSHWAILARSLEIPSVVGTGDITSAVREGMEILVDGRNGRVVLEPDASDRRVFDERQKRLSGWQDELQIIAGMDSVTRDGQPISLRANLDLPGEVEMARRHGAAGIGLFRTEFLVVGRSSMPGEEEQFEAYRNVARAFDSGAVCIRTFDLGGDKFPIFLHLPQQENPFLGWRAIRVCLDRPELFRPQLRAFLRATPYGDLRMMLPMVNEVDEIRAVRSMLAEEEATLRAEGVPYNAGYKLGVLIETPAAALYAGELARHCDFFSIGTNDLVQYTLAVDRTNARLAPLYNPFHPSVLRQIHQVARTARAAGIEVSVCGELAANPLGTFLLLGLDITALSVAWPSLPEIKKVIRNIRIVDAREAAGKALAARTPQEVTKALLEGIGDAVDLSVFSGRWTLSPTRHRD